MNNSSESSTGNLKNNKKSQSNSNVKGSKNSKKSNNSNVKWLISVFIITFVLSIVFSFLSTNSISNLSIFSAILILFLVILVGIFFDIVGVAVTVADEDEFHAKASKRIAGSKTSVKLIRNSAKVANFCADIVGDICGVLSGSISALIAIKITDAFNLSFNLQFIISAIVASLTVTGKAFGKNIAQKNSAKIVHVVASILNKMHLN